jgi:cholesterol transport system auxiliary component
MSMKVPSASPSPARRGLLLLLPALAGCSVLPSRPYQEVQRFSLAPERPQASPPPARGPVLLLRSLRAAPGMDTRGLRVLGPGGQVTTAYWQEWTAPPVELVEEALRRWLTASGLFSAVTAPGSRLPPDLVLEGELVRLQAESEAAVARAALSVLLLSQTPGRGGQPRILGQFMPEGSAPLAGGPWRDGEVPGPTAAAGMSAALAMALTALERDLRAAVRARR